MPPQRPSKLLGIAKAINRITPYVRHAMPVARAGYKAYTALAKRSRSKSRNLSGTNRQLATVTRQHDLRTQYKKPRMSRKIKRLKKFAKKVRAAEYLNLPVHSLVEAYPSSYTVGVPIGDASAFRQIIFGMKDTQNQTNDLRLYQNVTGQGMFPFVQGLKQALTDEAGTVIPRQPDPASALYDFHMQSGMDIAIKNVSGSSYLIDIYVCRAAQDIVDSDHVRAYRSWQVCMAESETMNNAAGNNYTLGDPTVAGCTPMHAPGFGSYWKILNKQRIEMQPGEIVSTKLVLKGKNIHYPKWDDKEVKKGVTHDVIIVFAPTFNEFLQTTPVADIQISKQHLVRVPQLPASNQLHFTGQFALT